MWRTGKLLARSISEKLTLTIAGKGRTRMLLTSIPYFKEVIIMSFHCDHCGVSNNEVQSAGAVRGQLEKPLMCRGISTFTQGVP